MKLSNTEITLIGNDPSLAYLIARFAEQSGCQLTILKSAPVVEEIWAQRPRLVLFATIEGLESAQALVSKLAGGEIPVGVCVSLSDEARARELGADHCLVHPLTLAGFMTALRIPGASIASDSGLQEPQIDN